MRAFHLIGNTGPGRLARPWWLMAALGLLLLASLSAAAAPTGGLLLVVLDQVSWAQLRAADTPHLDRLLARGAVALMNTRKPGEHKFAQAYLNLGAGANTAVSGSDFAMSFGVDAHNQGQYRVSPGYWEKLLRDNVAAGGQGIPGLLGETLQRAGRHPLVLVLAEEDERLPAAGSSLLMDDSGGVPGGWLRAADLGTWAEAARAHLLRTGPLLLVWTPPRGEAPPPLVAGTKTGLRDELHRVDALLGEFLRRAVDLRRDRVIVMSAAAPGYRLEHEHSPAWIIAAGAGLPPGLLTSASTRRAGLVANTDFAPTVLELLGLSVPPQMTGRPWQVLPQAHAEQFLDRFNRQAVTTWRVRYWMVRSFALYQGVVVVPLLIPLLWAPGFIRRWRRLLLTLALAGLAQPAVMLAMGPWPLPTAWQGVALLYVLSLALGFVVSFMPGVGGVVSVGALGALLVVGDALVGCPLMRTAVMSYDPIMGSRYYGMGNEYMAVMVMSAVLAAGLLAGGRGLAPRLLVPIGVVLMLLTGLSQVGANFGGALTAAAGLGTVWLVLAGGRPRRWHLAAVVGMMAGAALLVLALEAVQGGAGSHIGRMVALVQQAGWQPALAALRRKLEMNWRLLFFSRWSAYPVLILALTAWEAGRPRVLAGAIARWPGVRAVAAGGVMASVATMLFNDSGFAAGSIAVSMMSAALIAVVLAAAGKEG